MIRVFWLALAVSFGAMLGIVLAGRLFSRPPPPGHLVLEQIQQMATLATSRIEVADVHTTVLTGATGSLRMVVLVRGEALVGVDLSEARLETIDAAGRCAVLVLPPPEVLSARIDHHRTAMHSMDATGLWRLLPPDAGRAELTERCMREAEHRIRRAGDSDERMRQARIQAETVIGQLGDRAMQWTLTVRWLK